MNTIILPAPVELYTQVLENSTRMKVGSTRKVPRFSGVAPTAAYDIQVAGKRFKVVPEAAGYHVLTRTF